MTFDVTDQASGEPSGDAVVLLHGFPERSTCWRFVAPLLHDAGLRTIAPDQRGYSPGARPSRRRDYTLRELSDDVIALLEELLDESGPAHLVGHDWGSVVGWAVATRRPDLVRTWTAFSVPHPAAYAAAFRHSRQFLRSWYMGAFQLPYLPELLSRPRGGALDRGLRGLGMSADEVARYREEIVEYGALSYAMNWYRALPFADRDLLHGRVRVPTTMVWSDRDGAIDRWGVEACERYVAADYELVVLEGVTHWIPTQAPQAAADAILARIRG